MFSTGFEIADYRKVDYLKVATDLILNHFGDDNHLLIFYFGSRVAGDFTRRSDLDVGLWRTDGKPVDLVSIGMLREKLDDSIVLWKVDLVDFGSTSQAFRTQALKQFRLIWGSESDLRLQLA